MRSGSLRHRVTLQSLVAGSPDRDSGGAPDEAWTDVVTVFASVEPLRGAELLRAQQVDSEVSGQIRIRYRAGVTSKMRAVFDSRNYDILAVIDPRERNHELLLLVREGLSDG